MVDEPPTDRQRRYGRLQLERATGRAPEMESSKAVAAAVASRYAPGTSVLDVGCGAGHYLRSLRQRVAPDVAYRGVDRSPYFIELARQAFPGEDLFQVADVHDLPFDDRSFDLVFCANVLPNLPPPPRRALSELLRVARRHVIVRTLFADMNYVVREYAPEGEGAVPTLDDDQAVYNNMYAESYYRALVAQLDPEVEIEIRADEEWAAFDSRGENNRLGTRVVDGRQVAGPLVLDWRFITLTRP